MKTKELIRALQELDPSGELEVVAGNTPIYFAEKLPAYYDGSLEILIQDKSRTNYNILGYRVTNQGNKIMLRMTDIEDVIWDNPDAVIDLSGLAEGSNSLNRWQDKVEKIRRESQEDMDRSSE